MELSAQQWKLTHPLLGTRSNVRVLNCVTACRGSELSEAPPVMDGSGQYQGTMGTHWSRPQPGYITISSDTKPKLRMGKLNINSESESAVTDVSIKSD